MAPLATTPNTQYESISLNGKSSRVNHASNHGKEYGKILTKEKLKGRIEGVDTDTCEAGEEDAFFVADMGDVYRQHLRWKMNLKRVKPHYGTLLCSNS
jgi:ornithine decarboxylase